MTEDGKRQGLLLKGEQAKVTASVAYSVSVYVSALHTITLK